MGAPAFKTCACGEQRMLGHDAVHTKSGVHASTVCAPAKKHTADEDCTVDASTNTCIVCDVEHGETCSWCCRRAFHAEWCPETRPREPCRSGPRCPCAEHVQHAHEQISEGK